MESVVSSCIYLSESDMTNNDLTISTLNDLIRTSKQNEQGFADASQHVLDLRLRTLFLRRSWEFATNVAELKNLVTSLGGKPADLPTFSGVFGRIWIDLKAMFSRNDDLAVLYEVERGEYIALKAYYKAAKQDMPLLVRAAVIRQLHDSKCNHSEIKEIRDYAGTAAVH